MRTLFLVLTGLALQAGQIAPGNARVPREALLVAEQVFKGTVRSVEDGDTLVVSTAAESVKVHLEGIDAPEMSQAGGFEARAALAELVSSKPVTVRLKNVAERLARVEVNGVDVSLALVRRGLAWHCPRYTSDRDLATAETEARAGRRGLWVASRPTPPWLHRGAGVCWQESGGTRKRELPDFSGRWKAVSPPQHAGQTLTIEQDATHLTLEHELYGSPTASTYKLNGMTSVALSTPDGPIDIVAKARWEGAALVVDERTWAVRGHEATNVRQTLWFDDRGQLHLEVSRPRPIGEFDATVLVLRRDPEPQRDVPPASR